VAPVIPASKPQPLCLLFFFETQFPHLLTEDTMVSAVSDWDVPRKQEVPGMVKVLMA
jgi:hypothetical protein